MTGDVGTFDPTLPAGPPDPADLKHLVRLIEEHGDEAPAALETALVQRLAGLARLPAEHWTGALEQLEDDDLNALIRFLTLAESALQGWEGGAQSAVIPLFAAWRRRGLDGRELTRWIRAHSKNRFIPHGSLQDRL